MAKRPRVIGRGETVRVRAQRVREAAGVVPTAAPHVSPVPPSDWPASDRAPVGGDDRALLLAIVGEAAARAKRRAPRAPVRQMELTAAASVGAIAQLLLDRLWARVRGL